ncbi:MAG: hypothetical protein II694_06570 [Lachnospiraceae bacterium]|nr:hypothetical protein [Lachnospiraceae bacterium]
MTYKYWETCAERELGNVSAAPVEPSGDGRELSAADDRTAVVESEKDGIIPDSASFSGTSDNPVANIDSSEYVKSEADKAGTVTTGTDNAEQENEFKAETETQIVDLQEIRRDREDTDRQNREIDEFFAEEERLSRGEGRRKSIARLIFVDGLLGVPLLVLAYVAAAGFLLIFGAVIAALFIAGLALMIGAVIVICNSFRIFSVNTPTALVCIGASVAAVGIGLLLWLLCLLTANKLLPFIFRLPLKLEKKLRLFKD